MVVVGVGQEREEREWGWLIKTYYMRTYIPQSVKKIKYTPGILYFYEKKFKMLYYAPLTLKAEVDLVDRYLVRKALGTTLPLCGKKGKGKMWTEGGVSHS